MNEKFNNLNSLPDFLCANLRSDESFALTAPGSHFTFLLESLAACANADHPDCAIILSLDHYRLHALSNAFKLFIRKYAADFPHLGQSIKLVSSHDLASDALLSRTPSASPLLSNCWRIILYISDLDLGSLGLAYYEWLLGAFVGNSIPVGYFCPTTYLSKNLFLWFEKHGVTSLHHFRNSKLSTHTLPSLVLENSQSPVSPSDDALFSSTSIPLLSTLAESIHRHGGKTHAYYNDGDKREPLRKNSSVIALHPHIDDLPRNKTWKSFNMLCPESAVSWRVASHAVDALSCRLIARSVPQLIAGAALLASENNDLETLLPGPFSRAVIGAYLNYASLLKSASPLKPASPSLAPFIDKLVPQYTAYWHNIHLLDHLDHNAQNLLGTPDPILLSQFWMHSRSVSCFDPNGELLGSCSPIRAAFSNGKFVQIADSLYESASNGYPQNGDWRLKPASLLANPTWYDASSALFGFEAAQYIKKILASNDLICTEFAPDENATLAFQQLRSSFEDLTSHTKFAEYSASRMKWWTFAGGILNASLTSILLLDPRVSDVHFSNCAIEFALRSQTPPTPSLAADIINDALAYAASPHPILSALVHTWFWVPGVSTCFPLLGDAWKTAYIQNVLKNQSLTLSTLANPDIISVPTFHILMEHSVSPVPTSDLDRSPSPVPSGSDVPSSHLKIISKNFVGFSDSDSILYKNFSKNDFSDSNDTRNPPSNATLHDSSPAQTPDPSLHYADGYYKLLRGNGSKMHTRLPWIIVNTPPALNDAVNHILREPFIGLDVETTLFDQKLCFVQIGCRDITYLIDPLYVSIAPLAQVFSNPKLIKVIHNKSFECNVLGKLGFQINNIVDTCSVSKKLYGSKTSTGVRISHKLSEVCLREFNYTMDKTNQTSRWEVRPLSDSQLEYAALDAEILVHLYHHFFIKSL